MGSAPARRTLSAADLTDRRLDPTSLVSSTATSLPHFNTPPSLLAKICTILSLLFTFLICITVVSASSERAQPRGEACPLLYSEAPATSRDLHVPAHSRVCVGASVEEKLIPDTRREWRWCTTARGTLCALICLRPAIPMDLGALKSCGLRVW